MFNLLNVLFGSEKEKRLTNDTTACMNEWRNEYSSLLEDYSSYIDPLVMQAKIREGKKIIQSSYEAKRKVDCLRLRKKIDKSIADTENNIIGYNRKLILHNNAFVGTNLLDARKHIGMIESISLDRDQLGSIIKDARNSLTVGGAGTGKTTTIVGKAKYLIQSNLCAPENILLLSFTNASAKEMKTRLDAELGTNKTEITTFHKLGMKIINSVNHTSAKITKIQLSSFAKSCLLENIKDIDMFNKTIEYFLYYRRNPELALMEKEVYDKEIERRPPIAIDGNAYNTFAEMIIANVLIANGIEFEYDAPYQIDTSMSNYLQYYPSFHLTGTNVYIDFCCTDKNGEIPEYFKGKSDNNCSTAEFYKTWLEWRRKLHHAVGTVLIECTAAEKFNDTLVPSLIEKLEKNNIKLSPPSPEKLWEMINGHISVVDSLSKLAEMVINQMKTKCISEKELRELIIKCRDNKRANVIIADIILPIYNEYQMTLSKANEIDFNDMINLATQYVREGRYTHSYKYVLIDEYQDISKSRYELLYALRKSKPFKLFCVGDDWQSIYRFAGSDINYILDFGKYWGAYEENYLCTSYRFSQRLSEISSKFIMSNKQQQLRDMLGTTQDTDIFEEIKGDNETVLSQIYDKLCSLPQSATVFIIGRHISDIRTIKENKNFTIKKETSENIVISCKNRPDLEILYLTIYKSKGLQADYVFILNSQANTGLSSKAEDAPILNLLLEKEEVYENAEERRLFYVAVTRAKKKVYVSSTDDNENEFLKEIKKYYDDNAGNPDICPVCGGKLKYIKNSKYGEFYGCENYRNPEIKCKYTKPIDKGRKQPATEEES